ncbi:hypothetical protein DICSQDRAFT_171520 [Dichomitus squalens LYAD-421 SS1]|uniref:Uncharacterized protein n=2 Tax=Dichomitus squalens TaxID=114155 RepID=A0A4Q9MQ93_9APHY|nr:uncharacterized protein DICSQDRAFT_171520 [Dichomitus squalens LYAD-421 SS1]EJF60034.1 hypothetical protein DICSQDRAFT_171520 [Dichomitus squalens LYAD-421 SS1]TBU29178.1 hypothetical protein BD311DRAFT_693451 [Dichomitus squalens]
MHCRYFISSLASILVAVVASMASQISAPPLHFEAILTGKTTIGSDPLYTKSPFGTRLHSPLTGGNLTDPKTGEVVATLLPTADDGIISDSGEFFPSAILPYVWKADGHLASITVRGIGTLYGASITYAHVETDSPTYSWMNSKFFLFSLLANKEPPEMVFTLYGAANTTHGTVEGNE